MKTTSALCYICALDVKTLCATRTPHGVFVSKCLGASSYNAEALYDLFGLPSLPDPRFTFLAIVNTAELSSRLLPLLHPSPERPVEVHFTPYDANALGSIESAGIPSVGGTNGSPDASDAACAHAAALQRSVMIPPVALTLVIKKVSATGWDARFILDVVRSTVQKRRKIVSESGVGQVGGASAMSIAASAAGRRGAASIAVCTIAELPTHLKLVLIVAAKRLTLRA